MAAQLFRDQALTVSFSLIASLAVSLTLIPMLAALLDGAPRQASTAALPA
ncbi:MAG: efflux RND transporter permease subunit, partial [Thermoanaerobaculia bacterium]|nr:efflux RND transporter permease subunit [Thermoanaerobaculia bacterium]